MLLCKLPKTSEGQNYTVQLETTVAYLSRINEEFWVCLCKIDRWVPEMKE